MRDTLVAAAAVSIDGSVCAVWKALTTPATISEYLYGTETITDWKKGSSILFRGSWQGKPYEDKGRILAIEPEKLLRYTYWSSLAGLPDTPENYATITCTLVEKDDAAVLTIAQEPCSSPEAKAQAEQNWTAVLNSIKRIVEAA